MGRFDGWTEVSLVDRLVPDPLNIGNGTGPRGGGFCVEPQIVVQFEISKGKIKTPGGVNRRGV